jgi:hypothetical protein
LIVAYGVLPEPKEYFVDWPDREAITDKDIADVAVKEIQAVKEYVQGECYRILSPKDFYISFLKKSAEEAETFEQNVLGMEQEEKDLLEPEETIQEGSEYQPVEEKVGDSV